MNTLMLWLLLTLTVVACDRREVQPRETSDTTDTVILDPAATDRAARVDPLPPPATSPCAGMSGQAEAECRERERARTEDAPRPDDVRANEDGRRQ